MYAFKIKALRALHYSLTMMQPLFEVIILANSAELLTRKLLYR